jgi:predicted nucleic acid-binding protein
MLVIADSSPLIVLVNIGHIEVLPKLFGEVVIPPAVATEIAAPARPQAARDFAAARPAWLRVQAPITVQLIPQLHQGERERH